MRNERSGLEAFAKELKLCKRVSIFCHIRPDGDTLGSAVGLSNALKKLGIESNVVCEDPVPEKFLVFLGFRRIESAPLADADAYVAVDCSNTERMGTLGQTFNSFRGKKFNVDHHVSNEYYARYNYVEDCSACCELIYLLTEELGVALDASVAQYLLVGICTDSGNFAHKNVTERTLLIASRLVGAKADINAVNYNLFEKQKKCRVMLSNLVMPKMRFDFEDRFVLISISKKNLADAKATVADSEGFVNYPLTIDTVEVSACLLEMKPELYKVSLRSKGVNVNAIASCYGGGGHVQAAGCMIQGSLEDVIDRLSYTVSQYL